MSTILACDSCSFSFLVSEMVTCPLYVHVCSLCVISEEFQMGCVQLLVRQCGKMKGLRLIATHFCNLLLMGSPQVRGKLVYIYHQPFTVLYSLHVCRCTQIRVVCTLLENLLGILRLAMSERYLQPLCMWALQHFPKSQVIAWKYSCLLTHAHVYIYS